MTKVTEKNTKAQILDAYEEAMKQLKALKEGKTTTAEVVKAKEVKAVKESAEVIVKLNILNDDMMNKYNSLIATIEMLEAEIEELYGIKKEADSLEVLINTNKDMVLSLKAEYTTLEKEANAKYESIRKDLNKDLDEIRASHVAERTMLKDSFDETKAKLEKERTREKEEYTYNLKRERAIENDKWADEKATREAELAKKEAAVSEREEAVDTLEKTIAGYESKVIMLEDTLKRETQESFEAGKAKAKKDAELAKVFSDKAHKAELERKEDKLVSVETSNAELRESNKMLQAKLDEAYARIQNMAIEAAKNSGTRVIESSK